MMSTETEAKIAKIFQNLAFKEREVEMNRQVLGQNLDFDAYQAFSILDKEGKNGVTATNIVDFLRRNGVYSTLTEAQFMVLFYDENFDNILSYTEFLNFVLSESNFTLRRLARERVGSVFPRQNLPFNVEYSIVKLFEKELNLVRTTISLLEDVKLRIDFNVHDAFHLIKIYNTISMESLSAFLRKNMIAFNDDDILSIFKRLDLNKDRQIDFNEFHAFFCFPTCTKCCSCRHASVCTCIQPCVHCRGKVDNLNTMLTNARTTIGNSNQEPLNQSGFNLSRSPGRRAFTTNNFNMTRTLSPEVRRISPNLTLRMSPERKYSPRGSPMRNSHVSNMNVIHSNEMMRTSPIREQKLSNTLSLRMSPERTYSPKRNGSPIRHSPHCPPCRVHSPLRCSSPHHCCVHCHSYPCICCQLAYENGERTFLSYMKEVMNIELQIEKAKIDLAMREDFNVEDAFRIFELNGRGILTEADLKYGLNQLDVYASETDIRLLMKRIDLKKSGEICYSDFFDLVTPYDKEYRTMVENRPPASYSPKFNKADTFLLSTKIYLQNLIRLIINSENRLQNMKVGMREAREQLSNIYKDLDRCGMGIINDIDLSNYFQRKGVYCSDEQSGLAFIRLDRKRNGKVEFWEISEEITPGF